MSPYFSSTPWHPVDCRCGECPVMTPHQHEDDVDADTCEICFPVGTAAIPKRQNDG